MKSKLQFVLGTLAFSLACAQAQAVIQYTATDINALEGFTICAGCNAPSGVSLNNNAQIAGVLPITYGSSVGFVTGPNGLGFSTFSSSVSSANSITVGHINDSGQIPATAYNSTSGNFYEWFINGTNGATRLDLGVGAGGYSAGPSSINNAGQVAGSFQVGGNARHAYITNVNGSTVTDLGTLGGTSSGASDINNSGQVAGISQISAGNFYHGFITGINGVGMYDIGTLGGNTSFVAGLNDSGGVVGYSATSITGPIHAFLYLWNNKKIFDLGTLGDKSFTSQASAINSNGIVVGTSSTTVNGNNHAFITGVNAVGMFDLNSFVSMPGGVYLTNAQDINDNGQILATGSNGHIYLLSSVAVVPEAQSVVYLLSGLCMFGVLFRKKKHADNPTRPMFAA